MKAKKLFFFSLIIGVSLFLSGCATTLVPVYDANGEQIGYTEQRRRVTLSVHGGYQPGYNYGYGGYYYQQRPVYNPYPISWPR